MVNAWLNYPILKLNLGFILAEASITERIGCDDGRRKGV